MYGGGIAVKYELPLRFVIKSVVTVPEENVAEGKYKTKPAVID